MMKFELMKSCINASTITGLCFVSFTVSGDVLAIPNIADSKPFNSQQLTVQKHEDEPLCFMKTTNDQIMDLSALCQPVPRTQETQLPVLQVTPEAIQLHNLPPPSGDQPAIPYVPPSSNFAG